MEGSAHRVTRKLHIIGKYDHRLYLDNPLRMNHPPINADITATTVDTKAKSYCLDAALCTDP